MPPTGLLRQISGLLAGDLLGQLGYLQPAMLGRVLLFPKRFKSSGQLRKSIRISGV
jgi:hypothetical protein